MVKKLLTIALAKKMVLPAVVTAKVGQTIKPERVRIVKMDPKTNQMWVKYNKAKGLFPWNPWKKRMSVGSGADPVYIFSVNKK